MGLIKGIRNLFGRKRGGASASTDVDEDEAVGPAPALPDLGSNAAIAEEVAPEAASETATLDAAASEPAAVEGPQTWTEAADARRAALGAEMREGRWVQGDRLGEGGMGYVQRATDASGEGRVLKRVNHGPDVDPDQAAAEEETLRYESATYDAVGPHPNLAETYGLAEAGNGAVMGMEMLKGGDGDAMMADLKAAYDARKISHEEYWGAITSMQRDALTGVQHLGESGLVHGDMKPANLMYDETGTAKIIDLGAAGRIGEAGSEAKSHQVNMTPEWAANNVLDKSNDVYAMGQMAHAAVHGEYKDPDRPVDANGERVPESAAEKGNRLYGTRTAEHNDSRGASGWFNRHFGDKEQPKSAAEDYIQQTVTARGAAPDERRARDEAKHQRRDARRQAETGDVDARPYQAQYDGKYRLTADEALAHPFLNESMMDHEGGQAVAAKIIADRAAGVEYGPKRTDLELAQEGNAQSRERVRALRMADTGGVSVDDARASTIAEADGGQMALKAGVNQEILSKVPRAPRSA